MLSKTKLLMHEKVEYLFVQKTQGQNKLHPLLLTLLLQILFNLNFSIRIFAITLIITFNFLFILFNFCSLLLLSLTFTCAQEYFPKNLSLLQQDYLNFL